MSQKEEKSKYRDRDSSIVGHITTGVLHDFNNILQGIIGLAEMLDADPSVPEKAKISMKAIRRLGENATQLIQKIGTEEQLPELETKSAEPIIMDVVSETHSDERPLILVVEDDPLVLNVVTGMLKYLGYSTIPANDGVEAFKIFSENSGKIDLVITDLAMPRMGGLELTEKLLAKHPETRIIVMTGYLQEEFGIKPDEFGLAGWLEKPMTAERIRQVVEPILKPNK
ncbi:MAG: response regulator [Candidatus Thorarchaeota archaeon]|nr:response regulator [Candidatus Thorarchaeota archaeon]